MMTNQDEMFLWKAEPLSPSGTLSLDADDDEWLCIDYKSEDSTDNGEPQMYDEHPTRAEIATKLLEELDEFKEEPFSDWLEEKIDLPIFEELSVPDCGQNKPLIYPSLAKPYESTQTLIQEFENILGDVEAHHNIAPLTSTTLTPPQSPPPIHPQQTTNAQLFITLQPVQPAPSIFSIQPVASYHPVIVPQDKEDQQIQWHAENVSLQQLGNIATEHEIDELVRSCAEEMSPSSPCTSSAASCASSEDSTDDPEWMPEARNTPVSPSPPIKHRRKPYSRPTVEDKKVRKKEQNKNAATRYRQKKKQEVEEILGEERELMDNNDKLQGKVDDLQREIQCLKGLMRELFKAKGLMK